MMCKSAYDLFYDNINLAHYTIHNKFQGHKTYISGYDYEDILQVALIGLWKASKSFNPTKQNKFASYAVPVITNEILIAIRKNRKNVILNTAVSLNSIISDEEGGEIELEHRLVYDDVEPVSCENLKAYIYQKYKDSEKKFNIINSYVFKGLSQHELGEEYGYSQPQIHRIIKKFKEDIKKDFERNEMI